MYVRLIYLYSKFFCLSFMFVSYEIMKYKFYVYYGCILYDR